MWDVWEGAGACLPSSRAGLSPGSIISARACGAGGRIPLSSPGTGKSYSSISPFVPGFLSPAHNPCCPGSGGGSRLAELEQGCAYSSEPCPLTCQPPHSCRRKGNRAMTRACWKGCSSAPAAVPSPTCTAKSRNVALGFMVAEGSGTGTRPRVWLA